MQTKGKGLTRWTYLLPFLFCNLCTNGLSFLPSMIILDIPMPKEGEKIEIEYKQMARLALKDEQLYAHGTAQLQADIKNTLFM